MGRGIGLGCEQCDFSALLYERQPFALDTTGQPYVLASEAAGAHAGYWTDGLCGTCRLPVRVTENLVIADGAAMICPRCGATALTFEQALRELAEASHSRVWLDLHREQEAAGRLEMALSDVPHLRESVATGEATTMETLDALAVDLASRGANTTSALDGIGALLENALDLDAAVQLLQARLRECEGHIAGLRICAEDEAQLPGVPCPQCQTGHLIHWPVWE
ncbi:MAG TPA: hypothetical protein VKQ30_08075 [Ktedonobacterales bacterium]|nr:hypothetical protein [Ktedonobacterales bacterium]